MGQSPRLLRPRNKFTPKSVNGLALWLDANDPSSLYTTDAGPVTAVSSPLEISGCLCWYDAADASSITKDGSNLVSQWNDKSGNGRHATASGSLRPTSGGSQNGRAVMQFTGTQAMSITGNFLQSDNVTMFAVAMKNTDHYGGIITSAPTNPEDSPVLCFYLTTIAFLNRRVLVQQAVGNNVYRIVSGQSVSTSQQGWFDGVRGTDTTASVATNTANTITKIGALRTSSTADLNGNIAEIVCYSGNLSVAQRASVEAYLAAKWGITGVHAQATATSDPIGAWLDKSGNSRNATQSTAALRPTLGTLGSRNAVSFAGANAIATASYAARATSTYVYVGRHDDAADTFFQTGPTNGFHSHLVEATSKFRRNEAGTKGVILATNVGQSVTSLWCVDFSNDAITVRHNGVTQGTTSVASETAISDSSRATTLGRLAAAETYAQLNGRIAEFIVYGGRNLSSSERIRLERHLATKYGIVYPPQVSNLDAQDWIGRVYSAGGTVSSATADAVNTLCNTIDSLGLRSRFYRLNMLCGNSDGSLIAVRTPLYRSQSFGGTTYGLSIDTNVNFVAATDYAESSGLTGNASANKYLNTGFPANTIAGNVLHMGVGLLGPNAPTSGSIAIGLVSAGATIALYDRSLSGNTAAFGGATGFRAGPTGALSSNNYIMSYPSLYAGGALQGNNASGYDTSPGTSPFYVFAANNGSNSPTLHTNARLGWYSIGQAFSSASEVASLTSAIATFNLALGRSLS